MMHSNEVYAPVAPQHAIISTVYISSRYHEFPPKDKAHLAAPACMPVLYKRGTDDDIGFQGDNDFIEGIVNINGIGSVKPDEAWAVAGVTYDSSFAGGRIPCIVSGSVSVACSEEEMKKMAIGSDVYVAVDGARYEYGNMVDFKRCELTTNKGGDITNSGDGKISQYAIQTRPKLGTVVGKHECFIQVLLHNGL